MDAYRREHRLAPQRPVRFIALFYAFAVWMIIREGPRELIAGAPLFAVLGYALAAGLFNSVRTRAGSTGIAVDFGPLPVAPAPAPLPRDEVAKVYVRHTVMPTRTGGIPYLAAGVQRTDGRWYDLTEPLLDDAAVWRDAQALSIALQWPAPVEELWGAPPRRDWQAMRAVWYWTAATIGSIAWGCLAPFVAR